MHNLWWAAWGLLLPQIIDLPLSRSPISRFAMSFSCKYCQSMRRTQLLVEFLHWPSFESHAEPCESSATELNLVEQRSHLNALNYRPYKTSSRSAQASKRRQQTARQLNAATNKRGKRRTRRQKKEIFAIQLIWYICETCLSI